MNDYPVLNVQKLSISFRVYSGIAHVLDDVSLRVGRKENVGLIGETGCGKTVMAKTVMGMIRPSQTTLISGEALLNQADIVCLGRRQLLRRIGQEISMIPQDPLNSLNPVFTIGEQLRDIVYYADRKRGQPRLRRRQIWQRAVEALDEVRLPDPERLLGSYPLQLSGGMRQRVLIAMALVNQPSMLIADEPGSALDVTIQKQVLRLMHDLIQEHNISVLIISHNLGVIREMTDRLYIMYAGQVAETAPSGPFFVHPKHPYSQGLRDSVPKISGGQISAGIPGTVPDYVAAPSGCRFHPRCLQALDVCRSERPDESTVAKDWSVRCHLFSLANGKK